MTDLPPRWPLRQQLLGTALRQARQSAGLALEDAARVIRRDRSRVSRIESGERGITAEDLRALLAAYSVRDDAWAGLHQLVTAPATMWWQDHRGMLSGKYEDITTIEAFASRIMIYAPAVVPGLLHAGEYARATGEINPHGTDGDAAEVTAARREALRKRGTEVTAILGQGALRQAIGGAGVLSGQLAAIAGPGAWPGATVQVLPFASSLAGNCGFTIMHLRVRPAPAARRGHRGRRSRADHDCRPGPAVTYAEAFARLRRAALSPPDSARQIWPQGTARPRTTPAAGPTSTCSPS